MNNYRGSRDVIGDFTTKFLPWIIGFAESKLKPEHRLVNIPEGYFFLWHDRVLRLG